VAVSGGGSRLFEVDGTTTNVTLSGLAILQGNGYADSYPSSQGLEPFDGYGGGVLNFGTLTVSGCTLSGNSATAVGGGGIDNAGTLTVSGCTLSGNTADYDVGGGIDNAGTLMVSNSVFSSNFPDNIYGSYTDGGGNTFR
jgi:hypothetical protein